MSGSELLEKGEVTEAETAAQRHTNRTSSRNGEISRIDAMAEAPGVTMETFAHLDEKKILRKV